MSGLDLRGEGTWLRNVRIHGGERDRLRARQGLERALAAVDWSSAGHGPRSVLLVRHLRAGAGTTRDFGAGIARALREQARQARRPWTQPEAAGAAAVWFADADELAACLVRDWLAGALPQRWWWPAVLAGAEPGHWLRTQVLARGQHLVPVLALLAEQGHAANWIERLDAAAAQQAITAIVLSHGVPARRSAELAQASVPSAPAARPANIIHASGDARPPAPTVEARRRLHRLVPELHHAALPSAGTRLLAWALALARDPGWARDPAFAGVIEASLLDSSVDGAPVAADAIGAPVDGVERRSPVAPQRCIDDAASPAAGATSKDDRQETSPTRALPSPSSRMTPAGASGSTPSQVVAGASSTAPLGHAASATPTPHRRRAPAVAPEAPHEIAHAVVRPVDDPSPAIADTPPPPARPRPQADASPMAAAFPRVVQTRFGGLFYLLNAALAMGLYGDFTQPRAPGIALSPWDWLALLGREGLGEDFVRDPAWDLLAELAGRAPDDEPGRDFRAPDDWAVPSDWLRPWGAVAAVRYRATRARLRVSHPAGFALFDVARVPGVAPRTQARGLLNGLAALRGAGLPALIRATPSECPAAPRRRRWFAAMASCLRARLARALGVDDGHAVIARVCRQAASVHCSHGAIDVHLALADLPLEIRLAGLDRDPGWIPAAGRSVSFRFD